MGEQTKDPAAVALGRKGGLARSKNLKARELSQIGKKGAEARWGKGKKKRPDEKPDTARPGRKPRTG